jgi:hypothetical protein
LDARYLNGKQRAANRTNDRVNGIPSESIHGILSAKIRGNKECQRRNNHRITKHFERLIGRRERDPMEMNRESGGENRQVKIDAARQARPSATSKKVSFST